MKKILISLLSCIMCINIAGYSQNDTESLTYQIKCTDIESVIIDQNRRIDLLLKPEVAALIKQIDFSDYSCVKFDFYEHPIFLMEIISSVLPFEVFIFKHENQIINDTKLSIGVRHINPPYVELQAFMNSLFSCMIRCRYGKCDTLPYHIKCADIENITITQNGDISLALKSEVAESMKQVDFSKYDHVTFDFYEHPVFFSESIYSGYSFEVYIHRQGNQIITNNQLTIKAWHLIYSDRELQEFMGSLLNCMKRYRYGRNN